MSGIELFESSDGAVSIEIVSDDGAVWASQAQIEKLFGIDQSRVSRHVQSVFRDGEIDRESNMRKTHIASADRPVAYYSLDVILAVGYRARSGRAIEFRRWATDVLRRYLLDGAALNERRLSELGKVVSILARSADQLASGIAEVVNAYLPGLVLLHDYDEGSVLTAPKEIPTWELTLAEARGVIAIVAAKFPNDTLAGRERGGTLEGLIAAVYQGFGGRDVYPTVEEKAAHLLYFVVKDHPLADGNKRSAAALFVSFLARNGLLYDASGTARITNNALAALTLFVATSDPQEKELMITLIIKMLEIA